LFSCVTHPSGQHSRDWWFEQASALAIEQAQTAFTSGRKTTYEYFNQIFAMWLVDF
jgi:hypothetical protein